MCSCEFLPEEAVGSGAPLLQVEEVREAEEAEFRSVVVVALLDAAAELVELEEEAAVVLAAAHRVALAELLVE